MQAVAGHDIDATVERFFQEQLDPDEIEDVEAFLRIVIDKDVDGAVALSREVDPNN